MRHLLLTDTCQGKSCFVNLCREKMPICIGIGTVERDLKQSDVAQIPLGRLPLFQRTQYRRLTVKERDVYLCVDNRLS